MQHSYSEREPLYIIILRTDNAETLLKAWANENHRIVATVENNRLKLYHSESLNHFIVTWKKHWDRIMIWDTWNKRHITT